MRKLYDAANGVEAHMIVDLLKQEGIAARTDGEYLQGAVGGLPATGIVRVMIDEDQYQAGRAVIDRWNAAQPVETVQASRKPPARWPYLVVGAVIGAVACSVYLRSPVSRGGIDHNGDGVLDEKWTYSSRNLYVKAESDRNLDGKVDMVTRYDERGLASEAEADDNFDGVFEMRLRYRLGNVQVTNSDTDGDGFEDMRTHYVHGTISTIEYLEPRSGRPIKVEYYKVGKIASAEIDTNADGTMDRRVIYDGIGETVRTENIQR